MKVFKKRDFFYIYIKTIFYVYRDWLGLITDIEFITVDVHLYKMTNTLNLNVNNIFMFQEHMNVLQNETFFIKNQA